MHPAHREAALLSTIVALSDTLVSGYDIADLLHRLIEDTITIVDADAAGIVLITETPVRPEAPKYGNSAQGPRDERNAHGTPGCEVVASTEHNERLFAMMQSRMSPTPVPWPSSPGELSRSRTSQRRALLGPSSPPRPVQLATAPCWRCPCV